MDLSKLPKLSNTPAPPPEVPASSDPANPPRPDILARYEQPVAAGRGAEAWISIGVGVILLFAFPNFTLWWIHVVFHTKPPAFLPITDAMTGAEIPYPKSVFFWSDLCVDLFAYALVVEGIALVFARRPGMVMFALAVTAAAVLLNLYYMIRSFGEGFPLVSAIAVVFGGYMGFYQWRLLQNMLAVQHKKVPLARG